jgi:hypothetical protein
MLVPRTGSPTLSQRAAFPWRFFCFVLRTMSAVDEGPMPMMIEGGAPQAAVEDPSTQLWQRGCVEGVSLVGLVYPASFAYPLVVRQPRRAGHLLRAAPLSEAVRVSALLG